MKTIVIVLLLFGAQSAYAQWYVGAEAGTSKVDINSETKVYRSSPGFLGGYAFGANRRFTVFAEYSETRWSEANFGALPGNVAWQNDSSTYLVRIPTLGLGWRKNIDNGPLSLELSPRVGLCHVEANMNVVGGGGFRGPYSDHYAANGGWAAYGGARAAILLKLASHLGTGIGYEYGYSHRSGMVGTGPSHSIRSSRMTLTLIFNS